MNSGSGAELASYLKMLRESNELSQPQLAARLGLAGAYATKKGSKSAGSRISKFENGHAIPTDQIVDEYGKLSGADVAALADLVARARAGQRPSGRPRRRTTPSEPTDAGVPEPRWWRRHLIPLLIAGGVVIVTGVALLVVGLFTGSDAAPLSVLYARDGKPIEVRTCPDTRCAGTTLPTGTKVRMVCFRDAQDLKINYSSPRWFNLRKPGSRVHGWVHSSEVYKQAHVGPC